MQSCTRLYLSQCQRANAIQQYDRLHFGAENASTRQVVKQWSSMVVHRESLTDSRYCRMAAWQSADAQRSLSSWHSATLTSSRRRRRWPCIRDLVSSNTCQSQHRLYWDLSVLCIKVADQVKGGDESTERGSVRNKMYRKRGLGSTTEWTYKGTNYRIQQLETISIAEPLENWQHAQNP